MGEQNIVSGSKMAWSIIGWAIVFGIVFSIAYSLVYSLLTSDIESLTIALIISFVLQAISAYFLWKVSISVAFKNKTISYSDTSIVIRGIFIYTVVILLFYSISTILETNDKLEELSDSTFAFYDSYAESYLSDSEFISYQQQRQDIINEVKSELNGFLAVLIIGNCIIYIVMAFVAKKMVLKHVQAQPRNDVIIQ